MRTDFGATIGFFMSLLQVNCFFQRFLRVLIVGGYVGVLLLRQRDSREIRSFELIYLEKISNRRGPKVFNTKKNKTLTVMNHIC